MWCGCESPRWQAPRQPRASERNTTGTFCSLPFLQLLLRLNSTHGGSLHLERYHPPPIEFRVEFLRGIWCLIKIQTHCYGGESGVERSGMQRLFSSAAGDVMDTLALYSVMFNGGRRDEQIKSGRIWFWRLYCQPCSGNGRFPSARDNKTKIYTHELRIQL